MVCWCSVLVIFILKWFILVNNGFELDFYWCFFMIFVVFVCLLMFFLFRMVRFCLIVIRVIILVMFCGCLLGLRFWFLMVGMGNGRLLLLVVSGLMVLLFCSRFGFRMGLLILFMFLFCLNMFGLIIWCRRLLRWV